MSKLEKILRLEEEAMDAHVALCRLKAEYDKSYKEASQKLNMALTQLSVAVAMLRNEEEGQ